MQLLCVSAEKQVLHNEADVPGVMTFKGSLVIICMDAVIDCTAADSPEISSKMMPRPRFCSLFRLS